MEFAHFYMLSAYILVPFSLGLVVARGKWIEVLKAYGIWIGLLTVLGFLQGGAHGEGYGWMFIIAMFATVIAIPLIVLMLRLRSYLKNRSAPI
ncbi:MAG: hypothetical protein ABL897_01365 [Hyphomicrobium sp.]